MDIWLIFLIIAIVAAIIEIFSTTFIVINFAIAGIITAIIAVFWGNLVSLFIIFCVLSLISLIFLKPIFEKMLKNCQNVDFNTEYVGKVVKVIEPVTTTKGAITIYDERWEARIKEGCDEIPAGCDVKIIGNDSLVLFVERI